MIHRTEANEGAVVSTLRSRAVHGLGLQASNPGLTPKLGALNSISRKESKTHHLCRGHSDRCLLPDDIVTTHLARCEVTVRPDPRAARARRTPPLILADTLESMRAGEAT